MDVFFITFGTDVHRKELLEKWKAHDGQVLKVQYSVDESGIFSMGEDSVVSVWKFLTCTYNCVHLLYIITHSKECHISS